MADIPVKNKTISRLEAIGFVWDVFFSVSIPTVLFALVGRWLDTHWHSSPYATVAGLLLSLIVSVLLISRKAITMSKRMKGEQI